MKSLEVKKIVYQSDRVLLFGEKDDYSVIAATPASNYYIGQIIEYEPYGVNFGFHLSKKNNLSKL